MNGNSVTDGGSSSSIHVALLVADEHLRRRVMDSLANCSPRLALVPELNLAEIVIADHEVDVEVPVIFVGEKSAISDAMRKGCVAGLLPSFSPPKLRVAVDAVAHGLACVDGGIELTPALEEENADATAELTVREAEVLRELIAGASNKEIARRLDISIHTAKFHVASIITKLGANGRTDAVARALRVARAMI